MTISEFQSTPAETVIPAWHTARDGVLLNDRLGRYHLRVSKAGGRYTVLVSRVAHGPVRPELGTRCDCLLTSQPHWHY